MSGCSWISCHDLWSHKRRRFTFNGKEQTGPAIHGRTRARRHGCRVTANRDVGEPVPLIRDRNPDPRVHQRLSENRPAGSRRDHHPVRARSAVPELKSLKMYMIAYRNVGIFQENVVNRILRDVVKACKPVCATVIGEFTPRGGVYSKVTATWSKKRG